LDAPLCGTPKSDANYYDGHKNLSFMQVEDETDGDNSNAGDSGMKPEQPSTTDDNTYDSGVPHRGASNDDDNDLNDGESVSDPDALKSAKKEEDSVKRNTEEAMKHASQFKVEDSGKDGSLADNDNYGEHENLPNTKLKSFRKAAPKEPTTESSMKDDTTVGSGLNTGTEFGSQGNPVKRVDKRKKPNAAETAIQKATGEPAQGRKGDADKTPEVPAATTRKENAAETATGEQAAQRRKGNAADTPTGEQSAQGFKGNAAEKAIQNATGEPAQGRKKDVASVSGRKGVNKETYTYTPNTDNDGDRRQAPKNNNSGLKKKKDTPVVPVKQDRKKNKTTLNSRRVHNRQQPSLGDDSNRQSGTTRIVEKVCNEYTDHIEACKNTGKCGWCANKNACMPQSSAGLKACQVGQFKLVKFTENFNPYGDDESITKKHEFSDGDLVFINPKPVAVADPGAERRK
jgi:hypothetical protein